MNVSEAIAASPPGELLAYFGHVQDHAHALAVRALAALPPGVRRFADALDDGSPIVVTATVAPTRLRLDFTGSAAAHPGNLNAPRAVTVAAALYVVRALVDAAIPLNAGFLRALELIIPPGSILDPENAQRLNVRFNAVAPYTPFAAGRYRVTGFPANHDPAMGSLLYAVEADGRALFYGTDTAALSEDVF